MTNQCEFRPSKLRNYVIPITNVVVVAFLGGIASYLAYTQNSTADRVASLEERVAYPKISWFVVPGEDGKTSRIGVKNHGLRPADKVVVRFSDNQSPKHQWHLQFNSLAPCSSAEYNGIRNEIFVVDGMTERLLQFRDYADALWSLPLGGALSVVESPSTAIDYSKPGGKKLSDADMVDGQTAACG